MKQLEARFGKRHPALENFKQPPEQFGWLVQSYFRLHRVRQYTDMGSPRPLTYTDLSVFSGNVLRLDRSLEPLFYRCMEATDNAVLSDQYEQAAKQREIEKQAGKSASRQGSKRPA